MSEIRLAFAQEVDFAELVQHARSRGWIPETLSEYPVPATNPREVDSYVFVWRLEENGVARFVDDEAIGVQHFVLWGEGVRTVAADLTDSFPTIAHVDCLGALADDISVGERERALEMLGVIAPRNYDDAVCEAVSNGLDGDSVEIRAAAISATFQLSWVELRYPLQRVASRDPDPNNRAYASNALYTLPPS
ncbi:hypothetical protein ACFWNG_23160 [Streptomyces sp. NPDC058391]|uniref:hypothetical protein n=1 Tax=Streptomyces sp. NPDC058391 TaxID=3346476 RepID=UPI0036515E5C